MSEYFEYIDAYFQKQLSDSERKDFEQRCVADEKFAEDVAFYVSSRTAIRDLLLEQKKTEWAQFNTEQSASPSSLSETPVKSINYKRWIAYAAAACLILAIILFPWLSADSPQKLANNYVSHKLGLISQTMDASRDSLQMGIAAYNKHDYETAANIFRQLHNSYPDNSDALRYLGQTQLLTGRFDDAILSFEALAQKNGYSNPGLFLKSVALMQRNQGNDLQIAKGLLEQVVNRQLDGSKEAKDWLNDWPDK